MPYRVWLAIVICCFLLACSGKERRGEGAVSEQQATVQGSAPITPAGIEQARQAAISDAVANASLQLKGDASGPLLVSDIKVVDEWQEGDTYHVQALAVISKQQACRSPYRKRIVAMAFPPMDSAHLSGTESQDLFGGIPREIGNRLMESGDFIARNMTNSALYTRPDLAPEANINGQFGNKVILDIARRHDAQFVLSGVIRDFKIESTEYVRGAGVLAELKSVMRDYVGRRSVGIDVFVYDGFTGALLFQHRYTDSIIGDVTLPSGYTVGSERFDSTSAGHKITEIISEASDDIHDLFACYPFAARIARIENQRIVIAAGAQDKIRIGDRFKVYSAGFSGTEGLGFSEPVGVMVITDVGPSMAVGKLDATGSGGALVRPGDWVRSAAMP